MTPRPDVSEERRNQILEAATAIFSRLGFHKARMDDIAAASGLSKGTLYLYFKSKDDIILALLDRVFMSEMSDADALVEGEGTASQRLMAFARIGVREIQRLQPMMPVIYEFVALAARRESVRRIISGYWRHYQKLIIRIIRQGIESGEFAAQNPEATALALIALLEGLTLMWFVDSTLVDWDVMGDLSVRTFLNGLRTWKEA